MWQEKSSTTPGLSGFDDPLRHLYALALEPDLSLEDKVLRLLSLGVETLSLELGIVSQIAHPVYTCLYVHGPDWAPPAGATFDVRGTYCLHTLNNDGVTAFHHAGQQHISEHPCYLNFGLESYIGAPVLRGDAAFGTLNFSARGPRPGPFTPAQMQFVEFLARWLGNELTLEAERRALREQRSLLAAVIDAVPEAVVMADPNRRVAMVNPAVEALFGHAPEQLLGRQTAVLYETLDAYEHSGETRFHPGSPAQRGELSMSCRRADGTVFEGAVSTATVTTEAGEHLGYLGVIRDVTEQKRFERAKDHLIATVSHDLRTPLTSLSGALQLLAAEIEVLPAAQQKLLRLALRNAESIEQMVADILDVEQLRLEADPSSFGEARLGPLLVRAAESLAGLAEETGVTLTIAPTAAPGPLLRLHEGRIDRLLSNLLSNAIKASPAGGTVTAGLTQTAAGFWIRDQGGGIPLSLQPVLFDRFSRAGSYRVDQGHGLGLSIAKAIVDQHLGAISFETAEGAGTTFLVEFPEPVNPAAARSA